MTEPQILELTTKINNGEKLTASRKQIAACVHYWALRCAFEQKARIEAERKLASPALVLPNGSIHRN
jgi:hypothetical protein